MRKLAVVIVLLSLAGCMQMWRDYTTWCQSRVAISWQWLCNVEHVGADFIDPRDQHSGDGERSEREAPDPDSEPDSGE